MYLVHKTILLKHNLSAGQVCKFHLSVSKVACPGQLDKLFMKSHFAAGQLKLDHICPSGKLLFSSVLYLPYLDKCIYRWTSSFWMGLFGSQVTSKNCCLSVVQDYTWGGT